ncbi:MAG: DUF4321 domain-containing protein [Chitinispirillales bacterium]|jgi:hypothetical protein|nr:DUF4321 domain-containing protein [Chitinispirillales bacterium]
MAPPLKDRKAGTLLLIVLVGIVMGAYMSALVKVLMPGSDNVVKTFFTYALPFGVGYPAPVVVDLIAIKFQFGFQFEFTMLSILGVFLSLYFFRWYR